MRRFSLFAVALLAIPTASIALSGNELLAKCDAPSSNFNDGICSGYIVGVTDGIVVGSTMRHVFDGHTVDEALSLSLAEKSGYCVRPSLTNGQIRDVVVAALKAKPATRDMPAEVLILQAMQEAFPLKGCSNK